MLWPERHARTKASCVSLSPGIVGPSHNGGGNRKPARRSFSYLARDEEGRNVYFQPEHGSVTVTVALAHSHRQTQHYVKRVHTGLVRCYCSKAHKCDGVCHSWCSSHESNAPHHVVASRAAQSLKVHCRHELSLRFIGSWLADVLQIQDANAAFVDADI
jgi:hypothetical protein